MTGQIMRIVGPEPRRDGELPEGYRVGYYRDKHEGEVTSILERTVYSSLDEGQLWYDVFVGDLKIATMNGRYLAVIEYFHPAKAPR